VGSFFEDERKIEIFSMMGNPLVTDGIRLVRTLLDWESLSPKLP
jgi:hypothetical protein